MITAITWTPHALQRLQERFPELTLEEAEHKLRLARKVGKKRRRLIREQCPLSGPKYLSGIFAGRYLLGTHCGMIFVIQAPFTVITLFRFTPRPQEDKDQAQEESQPGRQG